MNKLNNINKKIIKKYENQEYFQNIFKNKISEIRENINKIKIEEKKFMFFFEKKDYHNIIFDDGSKYKLYPDVYNNNIPKIINVNKKNYSEGTFSKVYYFYNVANLTKRKNYIFKEIIIKSNSDKNEKALREYKSLIFNYLIQLFLKMYNNDKLKYLCNIYEIGTIKNNNNYYCIMNSCNISLYDFFRDNTYQYLIKFQDNKIQKIIFLLEIIKQCLNAIKILHDINYVHLDIKPENFLIEVSKDKKEFQVKIIDFGLIQKEGFKTTNYAIGSPDYMCNDLLINMVPLNQRKEIEIKKNFDIFSMGCIFIKYLYYYILESKDNRLTCPIILKNKFTNMKYILNERKKYNEKGLQRDLDLIKDNFKFILPEDILEKIIKLIAKMVNPNNGLRYQSIDEIIGDIDIIVE